MKPNPLFRILVCINLLLFCAQGLAQSSSRPGAVAEFQQFLSNPPAVSNLVFRMTRFQTKTNIQDSVFFGQWNAPDFMLAEVAKVSDLQTLLLKKKGVFAGRTNTVCWWSHGGKSVTFFNPKINNVTNRTELAMTDVRFQENILAAAMNLGIPDLPIGSIQWNGLEFEAVSRVTQAKKSGFIIVKDGLVKAIEFKSVMAGRTNHFEVRYFYDGPSWPISIPHRFQRFHKTDRGEALVADIQLLEVGVAQPGLAMDPGPVMSSNRLMAAHYFLGRQYIMDSSGKVRGVIEPRSPNTGRTSKNAQHQILFYSVLFLLTASLLWFLIATRSQKKISTTSEKEI